ncbi:MAG: trehalose-phosphatase [Bacteroidales bacterium]
MAKHTDVPKPRIKLSGIKGVILDMDGVITRTAKLHAKSWKMMFDEYLSGYQGKEADTSPLVIDIDYVNYIDGKPRYEGVKSFLESRNIELPWGNEDDEPGKETICGLGNRKNEYFHQLLESEGAEVFEDAKEKVSQWKSGGIKCAVVTSSKNGRKVLKTTGIEDLFHVKVDGITAKEKNLKGKPDPDIFLEAARQLNVSPEETIVFEDALSGVQAGSDGEFGFVIGVNKKGRKKALLENGADAVIRSFDELEITSEGNTAAWQEMPSALKNQEEVFARFINKEPLLFFDYDGTLTPIVDNPAEAELSFEMREIIRRLAVMAKVAVISGRDMEDVRKLVLLDNIYYAGSHGFRIWKPGGEIFENEEGKNYLPYLNQMEEALLKEQFFASNGVEIERKRYAIAVHYRNAREKDEKYIIQKVKEIKKNHPELKAEGGKKIIEIKPDIDWHKGKAIEWLQQILQATEQKNETLYMGDDITDEDGFRALINRGTTILVGWHGHPSIAAYRLRNNREVKVFLGNLEKKLRMYG